MNHNSIRQYLANIFVVNCLFSMIVDLAHDEAYYWVYSLGFSFAHYDHPPMVGWLIKLGVFIWGKNEFGVRKTKKTSCGLK